jgi:hypothetical protein
MNEKILTHCTEDARYRLCKCSECGLVAQCTPSFDFYTESLEPLNGEPLWCEICFRRRLNAQGIKTDMLPPMGGVA